MMDAEGCKAFSNTFQDLYGMEQLPGLASQHLMAQGYGYGGEGDWKVAAMTAILKAMGENGNGASAFMEDYTYHLVKGQEYSLGAHMLEVCPSVASGRPRIETHFLGIGMKRKGLPLVSSLKARLARALSRASSTVGADCTSSCRISRLSSPSCPSPNLPVARRYVARDRPISPTGLRMLDSTLAAHNHYRPSSSAIEQLRDWARIDGNRNLSTSTNGHPGRRR